MYTAPQPYTAFQSVCGRGVSTDGDAAADAAVVGRAEVGEQSRPPAGGGAAKIDGELKIT